MTSSYVISKLIFSPQQCAHTALQVGTAGSPAGVFAIPGIVVKDRVGAGSNTSLTLLRAGGVEIIVPGTTTDAASFTVHEQEDAQGGGGQRETTWPVATAGFAFRLAVCMDDVIRVTGGTINPNTYYELSPGRVVPLLALGAPMWQAVRQEATNHIGPATWVATPDGVPITSTIP